MLTSPKGKGLELLRAAEGEDAEVAGRGVEIHGPMGGEQATTPFLKRLGMEGSRAWL